MHTRVIFKKGKQQSFLSTVKQKSNLSFSELADLCKKHPHTVNDWYHEKTSIPQEAALLLSKISKVPLPKDIEIKEQFWYTSKAGVLGGKSVKTRHKNPGTIEGRSLGGKHSLLTHKMLKTKFKQRKDIRIPKKSKKLAELFGIILGDGGITKHQLTITLDKKTDIIYADYVANLIKNLFDISVAKNHRTTVINVVTSSTNLIDYLLINGLKYGNKVRNQIEVPSWIKQNKNFSLHCVKGLVDTDGCVYLDKHLYKGKLYKHICLDFTNASKPLVDFTWDTFKELGLNPTRYNRSIKLRRVNDVKSYFKYIGSSNKKHNIKFKKFINGEVA